MPDKAADIPAPEATPFAPETAAGRQVAPREPVLPAPEVPANRVLPIRVRVTPRYAAEVGSHWREQFVDLLQEANRILAPVLYARLEFASVEPWNPRVDQDKNTPALAIDLALTDAAQDVEWVVGLVGPALPPGASDEQEALNYAGVGLRFSKYLVMRALDDTTLRAVLQAGMQQSVLAPDNRTFEKEYRLRKHHLKRHMGLTIFLHELGHTLGVPHELDAQTMMYPVYNPEWKSYSDAAVELMRIVLENRLRGTATSCAHAVIAHLERTSPRWVALERDLIRAQLRSLPQLCLPRPYPREIEEEDQHVYAKALLEQRAWLLPAAWQTAQPLFSKYPDAYAVQELRCQLALQRGGTWAQIQNECARLMQLTLKDVNAR